MSTTLNVTRIARQLSQNGAHTDVAQKLSVTLRELVKRDVPRSMLKSDAGRKEVRRSVQSKMGFLPEQVVAVKFISLAKREALKLEAARRWNIARVLLNRAMDSVCKVQGRKVTKVSIAQRIADTYTVAQIEKALRLARNQ